MPKNPPLIRTQSAGYLTNWAARLFARAMDERLKPLGLTSAYLPVFFALAEGASLSQKALAHIASIEQPTMAATLNRMVRDNLLTSGVDPRDKRSTLYMLTPNAISLLTAVHSSVAHVNSQALSGLSPDAQERFIDTLKVVIGGLSDKIQS